VIEEVLEVLVFPGALFIIVISLFYEWVDRKLYARLQNRVGPHLAGPFGILQPFADLIKLLSKENIVPAPADRFTFTFAPIIASAATLFVCMFLPVTGLKGILSFEGDLIVVIAILSLYSIVVYLAGEGSRSRFASIGAARGALQLLGYEIPLTLTLLSLAVSARSLSIAGIVKAQVERGLWFIADQHIIGFIIFLIAAQAEMERIPFDIPEAEQEIVAGWEVEYTGTRLALFRLSEDFELFFLSGLGAALFLGGPAGPVIPGLESLLYTVYFLIKTTFILFLFTIIRAVFARLRIDQMISFSWKWLMPFAVILIILTEVLA